MPAPNANLQALGPCAQKLIFTVLVAAGLAVSFAVGSPAHAQADKTKAEFAILVDGDSGSVLFEKNADELMAPASMSKLMTMVIAFEALKAGETKLDDKFYVSENAFKMEGSRMFLKLKSGADSRTADSGHHRSVRK